MNALSILQPWAWLIANGHKDIENRTWATSFRGRFAVHAGKKWGPEQRADLAYIRAKFPSIVLPDVFDLGGIIGSVELTDCVSASESTWFFGPHGFVLRDPKPLTFIPWRGQLNFFKVPLTVDGAPIGGVTKL